MEISTNTWGLGLQETLLAAAFILLIADIYFQSDLASHIAYIIFSYLISTIFELHLMYQVLIGLIAWFFILGFHYFVWRVAVQRFVNSVMAPDNYKSGVEGLVNEVGVIKLIENKVMVEIRGDIWPCVVSPGLGSGDRVRVIGVDNGRLNVQKQEEKN